MGRKVAVVGVSGNGKTTLARSLAAKLGVPYVELDRLNHLPGWQEAPLEEFRAAVEEAMSTDGWVLDGSYEHRVGTLVYERADTVVWLDQPLPLVLWRLLRRTVSDVRTQRDLFNGNRQTWRYAFFVRDSLFSWAIRSHFRRRRTWPEKFAALPHLTLVRLRTPREVRTWLDAQG
jgi:adenylate kinase family enzyme